MEDHITTGQEMESFEEEETAGNNNHEYTDLVDIE